MRPTAPSFCILCLAVLFAASAPTQTKAQTNTQTNAQPKPPLMPVPSFGPATAAPEPSTPPAAPFHDARYGVSFTVPAAWNLTRKDRDVSTFALDARNAPRTTQMRAVATISFNPHPYSTFSGALFYFSVTPRTIPSDCAAQASAEPPHSVTTTRINDIPFTHGYDEHGGVCTESRDDIYTTPRDKICYRFDVVVNSFCGGDVSGVRDITPGELDSVRRRMQAILDSVRFDK